PIARRDQRRQYRGAHQNVPATSVAEDSDSGSQGHPRRGGQTVERLRLGGPAERRRAHSGGSRNRSSGPTRASDAQRGAQEMRMQTLPNGRGSDGMSRLQSEPRPLGSAPRVAGITLLALSTRSEERRVG